MGTPFIPLGAIIAVLIIAFLFASLPQVNHKTRYRVLYAIAIIMLLAVIPISEYMAGDTQNSSNNYLLVLIFDIAVENGLKDANITATKQDKADVGNSIIPTSLRSEGINGNSTYYKLVAQQVFNKINELGYLK